MEKLYYVVENNEQLGPFSIEDLKLKEINSLTLIWRKGYVDWVTAESIDELKILFQVVPPPIPKKIIPEVIIKTEEPLQFEDILKKEKIEKNKTQNEKVKNKTANEILNILKHLKYALILGILAFLISFGVFGGYKYLYYYFDAGGSNVNEKSEFLFIRRITSWDKYNIPWGHESFEKWASRFDLSFNLTKEMYNKIINNQDLTSYENEYKSIYVEYFDFINKNGLPEPNARNLFPEYPGNINKIRDFNKKLKTGDIIEKKNFTIGVSIYYGKIIIKRLNYAWYNSIPWGIGFFSLVFPVFYLILLFIRVFKSSKHWVEEHSKK